MPLIEINGKKIDAKSGSTIIEVADNTHIQIPRFCYHKELSIAANCRMCLVEVEKSPKALPACATPIVEGMKIWTRSPKALLAQKAVMEFLLINHPLDCPICDQGGECELQDLSIGYGADRSRYNETKRVVQDKNIGPLIQTDMTRCIQCTRCVRFGTEVAGLRELGATGRGECMEIGTFIEQSVVSEVSGNMIDLCPVGALTSKPFRFQARAWELRQKPSIAPHDCVGSHIFVHSRGAQVMRVVPKEQASINAVWISDRDRYSYEALSHETRLKKPKIKEKGIWREASWEEALEYTAKALGVVVNAHGLNALGALLSPNATLEESYLLQKLMRGLGSHNIDHRLRQSDFRNQKQMPVFPTLGIPIESIEQQSAVLLVGSAIHKEQPILGLKLRKMNSTGGKVLVINPLDISFNFEIARKNIVPGGDLVLALARVLKAIVLQLGLLSGSLDSSEIVEWLKAVQPEGTDTEMAKLWMAAEKKIIILGLLAATHPGYSQLIALAGLIAEYTGAELGVLTEGANTAGACIAGALPHRLSGGKVLTETAGLNAREMCEQQLGAYLLWNIDPELDCWNGRKMMQVLGAADFVVAINSFKSQALDSVADVLLPLSAFSESAGTFVNTEGRWQTFQAATEPLVESRPGWKILCVLANVCDLPGFAYQSTAEIIRTLEAELKELPESWNRQPLKIAKEWLSDPLESLAQDKLIRIAPIPLYASDPLVRRAKALQQMPDAGTACIRLNAALAENLKLSGEQAIVTANGISLTLPFRIDVQVPDRSLCIDAGIGETVDLGAPYSVIEIKAV